MQNIELTKEGWISTSELKSGVYQMAYDEIIEISLYWTGVTYAVRQVDRDTFKVISKQFERQIDKAREMYKKACERADVGGF